MTRPEARWRMTNVLPGQGTTVLIGPRFPSSTGSDFGRILPADALVPTRNESQLVDIGVEIIGLYSKPSFR